MKLLAGIIGNFLQHEAKLSDSVEEGETEDDNPGNKHVKNYRKEEEDQDKKEGNEQDDKSQSSAKWLTGLAWLGLKGLSTVATVLYMPLAGIMGKFHLGKHEAKLSASVEEGKTEEDNPGNNHLQEEDQDQDKKEGNEPDEKSQCCARTKQMAGLAWRGFKILAQIATLLYITYIMCAGIFAIAIGPIICTESAQGWSACPNATWICACPPY